MRKFNSTESFVLLVTTKQYLAADLIILELQKYGANYIRFNCEDFPLKISASWLNYQDNSLKVGSKSIRVQQIKSIWYRRMTAPYLQQIYSTLETRTFIYHESSTFLDGFLKNINILWVNSISSVSAAENKILQLEIARQVGFKIPKTLISNDTQEVQLFSSTNKNMICKPLTTRRLRVNDRYWGVFTEPFVLDDIEKIRSIQTCPIIIQERITRKAEVRITVIGKQIFACTLSIHESHSDTVDWHLIEDEEIDYQKAEVPIGIQYSIFKMMNKLGLLYGCFDFILTPDNDWVFLELNPSGQWGWIEKRVGFPITESLVHVLTLGEK